MTWGNIERNTLFVLMSGWLAGPKCRHFTSRPPPPPRVSASPRMSFTPLSLQRISHSLNVCQAKLKIVPSPCPLGARTTLSVLRFVRYHHGHYGKSCKGFICFSMFADWFFKIARDIILKLRDGEQFVAKKTFMLSIFVTSNFKRGFLAARLAHRWLQQIRLFPLRS